MKFNDAVRAIGTILDLRRIASAHVVDYRNLDEAELRDALIKVKPQYLHFETINENLETAFYRHINSQLRVLSQLIIDQLIVVNRF